MRECGDCTLCCTLLAVKELGKKAQTACEHEKCSKCSIYESRPQSCRDFECLWLKGVVPESVKPNKCHVVLSATLDGSGMVAYVDPKHPGAHLDGDVGKLLYHAAKERPVFVAVGKLRLSMGR